MINRRLLRIKVLQAFYAYTKRGGDSMNSAEKELLHSIDKSFELFYLLFCLVIDLCDYAASRIDIARNKNILTYEDLHPNTRFVDNLFIEELRQNKNFQKIVQDRKINWVQYPELPKKLFQHISKSTDYLDYLKLPESSFTEDKKFVTLLFSRFIPVFDDLDQALEERSIYWNDDLPFTIEMVLKMIKKSKPGNFMLPSHVFKNEERRRQTICCSVT